MRNYILLFLVLFCFSISKLFAQYDVTANKKGLYGIYDSKKKWILPATYTYLGYLPIYEKSSSVYILATDKQGSVIMEAKGFKKISPVYESIEIIDGSSKLFIVKDKNVEYFYQIGRGILTSYNSFDSHKKFAHNDNALLLLKGNQSSVYSKKDYTQTPFVEGEIIQDFDYQQYLVKLNNKYGVVGIEGNIIIPKEYDTLIYTSGSEICRGYLAVKKQNKWGIITDQGSTIIPIEYEGINVRLLRNLSREVDSCLNIYPVKTNGKWGIVNEENKTVMAPQYDSIVNYIHPLKFTVIKNGKRGIIDIKGNIIFPFNYKYFETTNDFSGEPQNKKYYFVNNTCTECNPVETEGGWGFADSTGKLLHEMNATLIPLYNYDKSQYENFDSSNYGFLWNVGGTKMKEVIDIDSVTNSEYDERGFEYYRPIIVLTYSYFLKGGKTGIIGNAGQIILPIKNDDLVLPLYNVQGEDPRPPRNLFSLNQANKAYMFSYCLSKSNLVKYKQNNKWGVTSISNRNIIPCEFDSIKDVEINRYDICEVSDSIQNTFNFELERYKCFKENNNYFYTKSGKFLSKRLAQEQMIGELNFVLSPPNKGNYYYTPIFDLIAINPSPEFHSITAEIENEEANEYGDWTVVKRKHVDVIYTPTGNKFNFFNSLTSKYLFTELIGDFILLADRSDRGLIPFQWSKTNDRVKIVAQNHNYYSTVEKLDNNKINNFNPNDIYQRFGRFDSTIFVKQNNKWYLRNLNEPDFKNKIGFDSVKVNSSESFIAYNNGSFATYAFNEINFNKTKIDFVFPDYGDHKLACSSCEYTYVDKKTKTPQLVYDAEGYEIQGDTINSITKIPLITKGKLNITNSYAVPILEKWADEIIFPKCYGTNQSTNLNDTTDFLFSQPFIFDSELSNIHNAKTIAYRLDKEWFIISLDEHKTILGPFDTIKNEESTWITTKGGETNTFNTNP